MKYLHTMVRISDIEDSLNFYENALGMVEVRRSESKAGRFTLIFLAAKEDLEQAKLNRAPLLELTYNWPSDEKTSYQTGNSFGHLAFEVENIYEFCQRLVDRGITINRPPRDGYMAFIKSPDGISIELLQKGERLSPKEPWASMNNVGSW